MGFYAYATNSNLIASITDSGSSWIQTRSYESSRDLLDVIETKWSAASKAAFDYTNDSLGRRVAVAKTGEQFSRYGSSGLDTTYGYNDRSELTSEVSKLGGTSTVLTGRDDAYSFDNIGNRTSTGHNASTSTYTLNSLNQYTQRVVPGNIDVTGLAPAVATVTVNSSGTGVTRQGDWYYKGFGVTNTSAATWAALTVASSLGGSATRNAFVALTPEPFAYDLDGNLTSDGRWDYAYDAENRLVAMQTHTALSPSILPNAEARRVEFKNDYLGRRVQKTVYSGWNGAAFTTTLSDIKFLYDGWNLIYELDALNSLAKVRSYVWGLDWSGTLQGAGGVGGLIKEYDYATTTDQLPAYDGNGNVMGLIKASDGTMTAAYEYDAFGQTLRATGTHAAGNPFRFSTKYTDTETGLVYYGLRYYSPTLGRFINKDPIEEQGGLNLYGFCGNNGVNRWDHLGMDWTVNWNWSGTADASWEHIDSGAGGYVDHASQTMYLYGSEPDPYAQGPEDFTDGNGRPMGGGMFGDYVGPFDNYLYGDTTSYLYEQNTTFAQMDALNTAIHDEYDRNHGTIRELTNTRTGKVIDPGTPRAPKSSATPSKFDRPIDASRSTDTYNCAGLCFRDYTYKSKADTLKILSTGVKVDKGNKTVTDSNPLVVVYYNITGVVIVDSSGRVVQRQAVDDFHVVGSLRGADNAASKNGQSPIEGPGPVDSFAPNQPYPPPVLPPGFQLRPVYTEQWYHVPYNQ